MGMKKKEFTFKTNDGTTTVVSPDCVITEYESSKESPKSRWIRHPEHYNKGIECWDYVVSHNMGFLEGNIIKYVTRYKHKNGKADLLKAKEYLDKLLEQVE
jgi:hypothetical protein